MVLDAGREDVFSAVADPTRRRILDLLTERRRSASELAEPFEMSMPAVSQHLGVLRRAGLVTVTKNGRRRIYALCPERLKDVYDWVAHYERFWREKLTALGDWLDWGETHDSRQDSEPPA